MLPAKLTHGHFATFPRTEPPRSFVSDVFSVFQKHSIEIGTIELAKDLSSDAVKGVLRDDLCALGFEIEVAPAGWAAPIQRLFSARRCPDRSQISTLDLPARRGSRAREPQWRDSLD
jgi:hypothetical protein